MAYTKYSLTPANNTAAPPDGAPEGMLPSAVNDTMRDMMAQIRDVGDGVRDGTYTMTTPKITGGTITGVTLTGNTLTNPVITGATLTTSAFNGTVGATTASTGAFTTLTSNGATTFTAGTASTSTTTGTTVITGGLGVSGRVNAANFDGIVGANTAAAGNFTTLGATGNTSLDGGTFVFNDSGADKDFRIEGDTDANLFFTDASADRIGIGTSSPSALLSVSTSTMTSQILIGQNASASTYGAISFNGVNTDAGRSGFTGGGGDTALYYDVPAGIHTFRITGSTKMILDASGNLFVNCTTTPSASVGGVQMCNPAGTACKMSAGATTSFVSYLEIINGNGVIGSITGTSSTTTYSTSSDYRLKENIAPMTGALATVAQLKPVTYKWKTDGSNGQGFIAHELQAVVPDCVTGEKDAVDADGKPKYQGVDTSFLVATLTKAIQEQQALIESLTTRLTALENK